MSPHSIMAFRFLAILGVGLFIALGEAVVNPVGKALSQAPAVPAPQYVPDLTFILIVISLIC